MEHSLSLPTPGAAAAPPPAEPPPALLTRPARLYAVMTPPGDTAAALLDAVRAGPEDRVLVVGGGSAELLCASIRRGCRSAIGCTVAPLHPAPADAVLAPRVRDAEEALGIAGCARRALMGGRHGRLALRLAGQDAGAVARAVARRLAGLGYDGIRCRVRDGAVLVTGHCIPAGPGAR